MAKITKTSKLVLLGCGGVGAAVLELWPKCKLLPNSLLKNLVIIEPRDLKRHSVLQRLYKNKYQHIQVALTLDNMDKILSPILNKGDIVFDCTVNVDALSLMEICNKRGCMYANCSMENWAPENPWKIDSTGEGLFRRSLCSRIWEGKRKFKNGPSMLADEGMNPGIVSMFALKGIEDMARAYKNDRALKYMKNKKFAHAAQEMGIRTIHITEHDTQRLKKHKKKNHFYNSWSAIGLVAESLDPIQCGKGTHEKRHIKGALDIRNMRIIPKRGIDELAWSYSPARKNDGGKFTGYMISHGEANTLSHCLTKYKDEMEPPKRLDKKYDNYSTKGDSKHQYRPSVYFVYQPSPFARESIKEMREKKYHPHPDEKCHVVSADEIKGGFDAVGAAIWSDKYNSWWSGCVLDKKDTTKMGMKFSGPTTIQVAIALMSAMKWMIKNPNKGFITPEDLPYNEILKDCYKYLGRIYSDEIPIEPPEKLTVADFKVHKKGSALDSMMINENKKKQKGGNGCKQETEYVLGDVIASGKYSSVKVCSKIADSCAQNLVKIMQQEDNEDIEEIWSDEVEITKELQSVSNVPKILDYWKCKDKYYIVLQKLSGPTLKQLISTNAKISDQSLQGIINTMVAINKKGIAHNDLHANNVVWNEPSKSFFIIDYGRATHSLPEQLSDELDMLYQDIQEINTDYANEVAERFKQKYEHMR